MIKIISAEWIEKNKRIDIHSHRGNKRVGIKFLGVLVDNDIQNCENDCPLYGLCKENPGYLICDYVTDTSEVIRDLLGNLGKNLYFRKK